jgi:hypothetical protein
MVATPRRPADLPRAGGGVLRSRELRPDEASVHLDVAVINDDGVEVFAGYASARIDS